MPGKEERRNFKTTPAVVVFLSLVIVVGTFWTITHASLLVARIPSVAAVISSVLVELTNNDRSTSGLGTLVTSEALTKVAEAKANDMATKGYFAHTSPEGLSPWHWYKQEGYLFSYAGENLAIDFSESADVQRAWMNSPTHRANVLGSQFTEIGIAVVQGTYQGRPAVFIAEEFGTPAPRAASALAPSKVEGQATTTKPAVKPATPRVPSGQATTTPVVKPALAVRELNPGLAPSVPLVATTLPTSTPTSSPTAILGQSAGGLLKTSTVVPLWYRIIHFFF